LWVHKTKTPSATPVQLAFFYPNTQLHRRDPNRENPFRLTLATELPKVIYPDHLLDRTPGGTPSSTKLRLQSDRAMPRRVSIQSHGMATASSIRPPTYRDTYQPYAWEARWSRVHKWAILQTLRQSERVSRTLRVQAETARLLVLSQ
jgi:hypothetical protein